MSTPFVTIEQGTKINVSQISEIHYRSLDDNGENDVYDRFIIRMSTGREYIVKKYIIGIDGPSTYFERVRNYIWNASTNN